MSPRARRIFAGLAVVFGLYLLLFEIRALVVGGEGSWFWLLVALLMVILGCLELFSKSPPPDDQGLGK